MPSAAVPQQKSSVSSTLLSSGTLSGQATSLANCQHHYKNPYGRRNNRPPEQHFHPNRWDGYQACAQPRRPFDYLEARQEADGCAPGEECPEQFIYGIVPGYSRNNARSQI